MPTYQYRCTNCGEQLEVVQKFSDDPLTICPACQGALRKVFSPVGIVFKGSGFYRTDSRNGSSADGAKKDKEPAGAKAGESGSASAGEAKSGANGSSASPDSGSSGPKKDGATSPASSAPAATGS